MSPVQGGGGWVGGTPTGDDYEAYHNWWWWRTCLPETSTQRADTLGWCLCNPSPPCLTHRLLSHTFFKLLSHFAAGFEIRSKYLSVHHKLFKQQSGGRGRRLTRGVEGRNARPGPVSAARKAGRRGDARRARTWPRSRPSKPHRHPSPPLYIPRRSTA